MDEKYLIRQLNEKDYEQYLMLINEFKKTNFTEEIFIETLQKINNNSTIYVIEFNKELIATATILYEYKFIHNISISAHIEDVCVKEKYRKNKIGKKIIDYLIEKAKNKKCYKIILDCDEKLENFYCKSNFKKSGLYMSLYF
jgi:glucosamine-phosphate N-acetyltransferase